MTKTRIALIQMKMSSEQTNNMDTAIRKIKDAVRKRKTKTRTSGRRIRR